MVESVGRGLGEGVEGMERRVREGVWDPDRMGRVGELCVVGWALSGGGGVEGRMEALVEWEWVFVCWVVSGSGVWVRLMGTGVAAARVVSCSSKAEAGV